MKTATLYVCEMCEREYRTAREAKACEALALSVKPAFKLGDIVLAKAGFGWYDGDRKWIANAEAVDPRKTGNPAKRNGSKCPNGDSNCFGPCCTFEFYYVVTHIDDDDRSPHRPRYHLVTDAMNGAKGHRAGYTFDSGHYLPKKVPHPPAHVAITSRKLIGTKATTLL